MDINFSLIEMLTALGILLTTPWVLLVLVSNFTDASVGYIDEHLLKRLNPKDAPTIDAPGKLILISGFFGIVIAFFALLIILFTDQFTFFPTVDGLVQAVAAGMFEVLWLIPYFYALNRGGTINVTPIFQTIPIFSLIIGLLFFNEIPMLVHIVGAVIIISGALLLNYTPSTRRIDTKSIGLLLFASMVISIGYFLFKGAAESGNFVAALFGNGLGMILMSSIVWASVRSYREQFKAFLKTFDTHVILFQFGNETLYTVSAITNQLAIVIGPSVMLVNTFDAFHPVFTLLIGMGLALAGSKTHRLNFSGIRVIQKTIAILIITAGAILIAIAG